MEVASEKKGLNQPFNRQITHVSTPQRQLQLTRVSIYLFERILFFSLFSRELLLLFSPSLSSHSLMKKYTGPSRIRRARTTFYPTCFISERATLCQSSSSLSRESDFTCCKEKPLSHPIAVLLIPLLICRMNRLFFTAPAHADAQLTVAIAIGRRCILFSSSSSSSSSYFSFSLPLSFTSFSFRALLNSPACEAINTQLESASCLSSSSRRKESESEDVYLNPLCL